MATSDSTRAPVVQKRCYRCRQEKPFDAFHKHRSTKDGLQAACIACAKATRKPVDSVAAASIQDERRKAKSSGIKACRACGCDKPLTSEYWGASSRGLGGFEAKCKACRADERRKKLDPKVKAKQADAAALAGRGLKRCPACVEAKPLDQFMRRPRGGWYSYCLQCCREQSAASRAENIEADRRKKLASYHRRRKVAGDSMRATRNKWRRAKKREDPIFAMAERVRGLLGNAVRKMGYTKRARTQTILGCDWATFAAHIERQFLPGMSWDNREQWHLDHIVPLATAETEDDVLALNCYTNLRPLWAKDNLSKGAEVRYLL